jgi:hypothetical protein
VYGDTKRQAHSLRAPACGVTPLGIAGVAAAASSCRSGGYGSHAAEDAWPTCQGRFGASEGGGAQVFSSGDSSGYVPCGLAGSRGLGVSPDARPHQRAPQRAVSVRVSRLWAPTCSATSSSS